jgi:hypothetical protein
MDERDTDRTDDDMVSDSSMSEQQETKKSSLSARGILTIIAIIMGLVGAALIIIPHLSKRTGPKPAAIHLQPPPSPINQDSTNSTKQMTCRGWYPVILRNDWPDSAMIVIPREQGSTITSAETTRFDAPGKERIVFVKAGRHKCELWLKTIKQGWVQDGPTSFPVATQEMGGDWTTSWDGRPSHGWIRCKATRVPERL